MVTISRAAISVTFPSRFMLAAAMNPCPCDPTRECHCTPPMIQRYVSKISGPLLDRIDIQIEVPRSGCERGLGNRKDARDRSAKVAAQAFHVRDKHALQRADGAEDDTQALRDFRRWGKAVGECGFAPGPLGARA